MTKLTHKTYFSKKNNYLSASKIKQYINNKRLFKQYYLDGKDDREKSDALIQGSAIDTYVTESKKKFDKKYECVKSKTKGYTGKVVELTNAVYRDVVGASKAVLAQEFMRPKNRKGFKKQMVLTMDRKITIGGHTYDGLCGMLDFINITMDEQGNGFIDDLKSCRSVHVRSYSFACEDFGYYISAAMYIRLAKHNFPEVESWVFRHIAVEKDHKKDFPVKLFILDARRLEIEDKKIDEVIAEMEKEKLFKAPMLTWNDAVTIGYYEKAEKVDDSEL